MLTDGGLSSRSKASTIVSPKGSPSFRATPTPISIDYPADAFDYVILSQTLQATRQPRVVLEHLLRIGRRAIVSVPNFGHWRVRAQVALLGRMPVTKGLPHSWYDTPNIHFCTIADFIALARSIGATIDKSTALDAHGRPLNPIWPKWAWNLLGEQAIFLLHRGR